MNRKIVCARIGSIAVLSALAIEIFYLCWSPEFDALSFVLYFLPIAAFVFVATALCARTTTVLRRPIRLFALYLIVTFAIGASASWRSEIRWSLARGIWKQRVLDQPELSGQLKHLNWDGWGFIGQDTEVYLVYDSTDRLRNATTVDNGRHGIGLPCDVYQIRRLQPNWYSVTFFTNTGWDGCT